MCVCSYIRLTKLKICFPSSFSSCGGLVTIVYFDIQAEMFFGAFLIHYCPVVLPTVFALCLWYTSSESMVLMMVFFRRLEKSCGEVCCQGRLWAHSCSASCLQAPQAFLSRATPQPHGAQAVSLQGLFLPRCRALHWSLSNFVSSL